MTFNAVFTIFSIVSLYIYYKNLEKSKTFIHAVGNGLVIELKENGNYIIRSGSRGRRIHHYGNYIREGQYDKARKKKQVWRH